MKKCTRNREVGWPCQRVDLSSCTLGLDLTISNMGNLKILPCISFCKLTEQVARVLSLEHIVSHLFLFCMYQSCPKMPRHVHAVLSSPMFMKFQLYHARLYHMNILTQHKGDLQSYPPVGQSILEILRTSQDIRYGTPLVQVSWDFLVTPDHPGRTYCSIQVYLGQLTVIYRYTPCLSILGFPSNTRPSQEHPGIAYCSIQVYPPVQVSRDSLITPTTSRDSVLQSLASQLRQLRD